LYGGALVSGYHRGGFFERNIKGLHAAMERALYAESSASAAGLLQAIDPRVKVVGLFALIVAAALASRLWTLAAILAAASILAVLSRLSLRALATRVWAAAFVFSAAISIPALFLTPGAALATFPNGLEITAPGLRTAAFLVLRVESSATLALLLIFTTPWMHVLKALRVLRAPVLVVVILGMTCRYILLLLETAHEMFEARKSRTVGVLDQGDRRRMAISAAGVLLNRSFQLSGDVYLAMQSRGFRGEVYLLDDFRMKPRDWAAAAGFAALAAAAIWAGRQ
jgi:cobalt/nickel transport system permease protein